MSAKLSMYPLITIARFTLLESCKNYLLLLVLIGLVGTSMLALFIGELTITETSQIQSSISALILRLFAIFIVCTFVITSVVREFNDKCFELVIALPLHRFVYLLGKMLGFLILAILIAIIVSLPLALISDTKQLPLWCLSLICELSILIAFSLLCLMTFRGVVSIFFSVIVFYLLARIISIIQLMIANPILETSNLAQHLINILVKCIGLLLPAFDKFTKTEWLVYGANANEYMFILSQTVIYTTLLLAAACFDLHRKNF